MKFKNFNKVIAGKKAKTAGDTWEADFEFHAQRQKVAVVRIPNGCKRVGMHKLIQIPSPFDYCLCFNNKTAHVDLKTTEETNFTFSMIKPHQIESLKKLSSGGPAGYIIAINNRVYFAPVELLEQTRPKGHVDLNLAIDLGHKLNFNVQKIFA